ncbi:MAG: DEAD/DEAH box helicase [Phenylobacterium sp.]|uniref:DEAD/DEAH box helicase n=1 Tax=Phenylobacterium sp. TaxID=1871053 RepID=UPI00271EF97E|nr:DEAD/DEAH box helicase [Phenylobacterium sp.]MDO8409235.1 DEAD/DEAH box helicase [Phenylobacterium sp.]
MPERDQDRLEAAERVRRELGIENQLSRAQARTYVRCLQATWQVPTIQWSERDSARQIADARRLLHAAHIFRSIEGPSSLRAIDCYRRSGEILEWLSRGDDVIREVAPIELLAAGAYQLGGLPAMASGLLSQMRSEHIGVRLYSAFLRADFDGVLQRAAMFWRRHADLTTIDAGAMLIAAMRGKAPEGEAPPTVSWAFSVELVRSLGLVADCLRRGDDERLETAMDKLHALDAMATRTFSDDASLVISIMRDVADSFVTATIYRPLRSLGALRPERSPRLLAYARDQFSRGRGILWTSQQHGLQRLLQEDSFALCTPTGSGKTLVANLALIKELLLREDEGLLGPLALYIVPSRALAGEVEAKLTSELGRDVTVTGLYGGADWGITDYWLTSEEPVVLIATVEKAEALLRYLGQMMMARLRLLIIDEAHQVVPEANEATRLSFSDHSNRSIRLEGLVSRILSQRPDVVRIALTAVAGGAAGPVARWVEGRPNADPVGLRYRSTRQVIGVLETAPNAQGRILLDLMNGLPLYLRDEEDAVYLRLQIEVMPQLPAQWRNSLNRFNCLSVLWTALHLADEDQRILISVAQEPEQTMRWYKEALERADWQGAMRFQPPEEPLRARFDEARAACLDYCGADSFELFLLDRGIATSHGQMPQRLRRLMVELIDRRICPITVATATLTEGVNLPFDLIFLTSLKRRSWDPVEEQQVVAPLTTSEFRNLAGRAGRPGASRGIEGMTLVALPTQISTTAAASIATQRRQRAELARDYDRLRASLVIEERDADDVPSPLALLLNRIWERANRLLGVAPDAFLDWLERTAPTAVSPDVGTGTSDGTARLADAMDELDAILLTSLQEVARADEAAMTRARAEALLITLWQTTFTAVATEQEAWLEQAFVRRGAGIIEHIYPDPDERRRLYQYGLPPAVGRRFEAVARRMRELLAAADEYGSADPTTRIDLFQELGDLVSADRGFGFRVRRTDADEALLERWADVLGWWMNEPDVAGPVPEDLRSWQRFVADNLEFRLGVAIGAVVAEAWAEGAGDALTLPSLASWKDTTGLPWIGFWARELLRWGTHDPFVAFCLAQGLAPTRDAAGARRQEFNAWLEQEQDDLTAEDRIDPQFFLRWQASLPRPENAARAPPQMRAALTGTTGERGRYAVMPVTRGEGTAWLDPAGFELAVTRARAQIGGRPSRSDYELVTIDGEPTVTRVFRPA